MTTYQPASSGAASPVFLVDTNGNPLSAAGSLAVTASTLPLPTGAATETTLAGLSGSAVTGQSLEAGGSGLMGWLSSLRKGITDRLPASLVGGRLDVNIGASGATVPVSGTFFQATQPVSAVALPLPAGASTEATLAAIKAKTDNLDVLLSSRTKPADTQPVSGTVAVSNLPATQPVSGTVAVSNFPATQPVSASVLPLPTGAATEATLATRLPVQGQALMAASTPVALASDQPALAVVQTMDEFQIEQLALLRAIHLQLATMTGQYEVPNLLLPALA